MAVVLVSGVVAVTGCSHPAYEPRSVSETKFVTINPLATPPALYPPAAVVTIPQDLNRPLHLPVVAPGAPCPRSPTRHIDTKDFGGVSLGTTGPVHPIIAEPGARRDVVRLVPWHGWYGPKTLWYARDSYSGPVLIRGERLDRPGTVSFGESPRYGFIADAGNPSGSGRIGVRTWPGATWVRSPGCYGFQVDGASFSYTITLDIRSPSRPRG